MAEDVERVRDLIEDALDAYRRAVANRNERGAERRLERAGERLSKLLDRLVAAAKREA